MSSSKQAMLTLCILSTALLGACNMMQRNSGGSYSDITVTYPNKPTQRVYGDQDCDSTVNIVRQNNPACVGKTIGTDRNGPTITVLKPGAAVPVEAVDSGNLAPPPKN